MRGMNVFKALYLSFCYIIITSYVKYDAEPFISKTLPRTCGNSTGATNDWIYLSLRTGERSSILSPNQDVTEEEQKERTDWDLAFCGYRLRTSSDTNGIDQGAVADLGYGSYDKWKTVSQLSADLKRAIDSDTEVYITISQNDWNKYLVEHGLDFNKNPWFDSNIGPARTLISANPALAEAMSFVGPPPVYTPSYHTYVIRTADGKRYFKIQIISWYDTNLEIGDSGGRISYYCDELS